MIIASTSNEIYGVYVYARICVLDPMLGNMCGFKSKEGDSVGLVHLVTPPPPPPFR
jgi:hypothetical protein